MSGFFSKRSKSKAGLFNLSIAALLAVALVGCGGGSGGGDDGTSGEDLRPTGGTVYDVNECADQIVASMGEDGGLEAVILALNNGFSLRQITDAAMTGRLDTDGSMLDDHGGIEYPEDFPPNIIDPTNISTKYVLLEVYNLEEMKNSIKRAAEKLNQKDPYIAFSEFTVIFKLLDLGYSPEQVFPALFLGNIRFEKVHPDIDDDSEIDWELMLIDDQGKRIVPTDSPRGIFSSFIIKIEGPTSLLLKDGDTANGTWNVAFTRGSCSAYDVVFYWGDGEAILKSGQNSGQHKYYRKGTYQLRAHLVCGEKNKGDQDAWTNTLILEVKQENIQAPCPEGTWDVKYNLNCSGGTITDEVWIFKSGMTWEKTVFSSCGWEGDWYMLGDELSLATNVLSCWYIGTVSNDCTSITGDGYFEEWHDCWTATKRP